MSETKEEAIKTLRELLAFGAEVRDTDLSLDDLAEEYGVSKTTILRQMEALVKAGTYITFLTYHPDRRRQCRFWREVES